MATVKTYPEYAESEELKKLAQDLADYEANKPGEYQGQYGTQIKNTLDNILNRGDFKYNFNADPLYQQYKNQYQQAGKMAMIDTMGQAAGLTGGYGSSYGQTVRQQVYNQNLSQLNDIIPGLQQAAYNRYSDELAGSRSDLATLLGLDESDYAKYRDEVEIITRGLNISTGRTGICRPKNTTSMPISVTSSISRTRLHRLRSAWWRWRVWIEKALWALSATACCRGCLSRRDLSR
jgi:hypothetical protein